MKVVSKQLAKYEALDFASAARYLAKQAYIDPKRVAIIGSSYGVYSTVFTMEMYPDLFPVGVANSPGTDWKLYDTIYTERYMGLLSDNKAGYEASSAVAQVGKLRGHLLLVHSGLDENVHPQHTMQLITKMLEAGKDADFRFFPLGAHGAAYSQASAVTMLKVYANTWCEQLKAGCEPANLN